MRTSRFVLVSSNIGSRVFSTYLHGLCRGFASCSATRRLSACIAGAILRFMSTQNLTPAFCTALAISQQSSRLMAMGFSQKTCLPLAAASTTIGLCMSCGVETLRKSTSGSSTTAW